MPGTDPASLHHALKQALTAGDFETVRQLSAPLGQSIIREAAAAAPPDRAALVQQGLSRLQEHLSMARVLRAHLAAQLQTNTAVCLYQPFADRDHSWHFEA
jgi:hypothetical protein